MKTIRIPVLLSVSALALLAFAVNLHCFNTPREAAEHDMNFQTTVNNYLADGFMVYDSYDMPNGTYIDPQGDYEWGRCVTVLLEKPVLIDPSTPCQALTTVTVSAVINWNEEVHGYYCTGVEVFKD